jgi:hypothetical protein
VGCAVVCWACGTELPEGASFCSTCGNPQDDNPDELDRTDASLWDEPVHIQAVARQRESYSTSSGTRSEILGWLITILMIIAILLFGAGYPLFGGNPDAHTQREVDPCSFLDPGEYQPGC